MYFANGSLPSFLILTLRHRSVDKINAQNWMEAKEDCNSHQTHKNHSFTQTTQRCLMHFLSFVKIKETWTWDICFPKVEKCRRKQSSTETRDQDYQNLQSTGTTLLTTSCHGLRTDPGRVFRQPPSCWSRMRWRHHPVVQRHRETHGCSFSLRSRIT